MSGVHTHMTNTANTPIESLEAEYGIMVRRLSLVSGSGGEGWHRGGDGTIKELEILTEATIGTVLSDSRLHTPKGVSGGRDGQVGSNTLVREETEYVLPSKFTIQLWRGDVLRISTPSGGGWKEG
jgi:N-methylhydantoinase B